MDNKLFGVEVFEVDPVSEEGIVINRALIMTVKEDIDIAENHCMQLMQKTTENELWEKAEATLIEEVHNVTNTEEDLLFCVKVYQVDEEDKEEIVGKTTYYVAANVDKDAQQYAIEIQQAVTGDKNWSVAEGQAIAMVEGWLIQLEEIDEQKKKVILEPSQSLKQHWESNKE